MRLVDLRRLAVRKQLGMECVNEHGLSTVPALAGASELNLEEEFWRAQRFTLDVGGQLQTVTRPELETMAQDKAGAAAQPEE